MAKYVIDGATLTAIADAIRRASPRDLREMAPEEMPDHIEIGVGEAMYDEGYSEGYEEGKAEGGEALAELPAPLVLQARSTPTYNINFKDEIFTSNTFNGEVAGELYYLTDFVDYEVMDSQSTFCMEFYNTTNRYVDVYVWVYGYDYGDDTEYFTKYISIPIAPNSSNEFEETSDFRQPAWEYEIKGAVFK